MAGVSRRTGLSGVVRSATALMFSTVMSAALGMVFWAIAARLYDTTVLGRAAAGASAITLLGALAQLSLTSAFTRFLPTAGAATGPFIWRGYVASAAASLLLSVGFVLAGFSRTFLGHGVLPFVAFFVAVACTALCAVQDGVLTALRRTTWVPAENIGMALAKIALLPASLAAGAGAVLLAWGMPIVAAVVVVSGLVFARLVPAAHHAHRGRRRMPGRRELSTFMSVEYLNGILSHITLYLPPVLVTLILGPAQGAVFYLPWLIGTAIFGLLWNIVISFTVEATTDAESTRKHLRHSLWLGLLVSVGGGAVLLAAAPWVLAVAGSEYSAGGATALRLVALSLPFEAVCTFFAAAALLQKKVWAIFGVRFVSAAIFLAGSVVGMHAFGPSGAAGAFLVAQLLTGGCLIPVVVRQYRVLSRRTVDTDATAIIDMREIPAAARARDAERPHPAQARGVAAVPRVNRESPIAETGTLLDPRPPDPSETDTPVRSTGLGDKAETPAYSGIAEDGTTERQQPIGRPAHEGGVG